MKFLNYEKIDLVKMKIEGLNIQFTDTIVPDKNDIG